MIRPLHDNIVLRRETVEKKTASGIILSGDSKEQPMVATVIAVGPGRMYDGVLDVPALSVGDKVVYKKYSATELKIESEDVLVIAWRDVLAVVE
jgi:chaperonin GroES